MAFEHQQWRHWVRNARVRAELSVYDVPLLLSEEESYFGDGGEGPSELCVVAVGGYARREMTIHSDVDLLFLYRDRITPHVAAVAERLQLWLWDSQVTVGGATRTIGARASPSTSSRSRSSSSPSRGAARSASWSSVTSWRSCSCARSA